MVWLGGVVGVWGVLTSISSATVKQRTVVSLRRMHSWLIKLFLSLSFPHSLCLSLCLSFTSWTIKSVRFFNMLSTPNQATWSSYPHVSSLPNPPTPPPSRSLTVSQPHCFTVGGADSIDLCGAWHSDRQPPRSPTAALAPAHPCTFWHESH